MKILLWTLPLSYLENIIYILVKMFLLNKYVPSSSKKLFSVHAGGMNVVRLWQRISFLIYKMELWTCELMFAHCVMTYFWTACLYLDILWNRGPGITAGAASKPGSGDGNSDDDMDSDKRRKHGKDSSKGADSLSGAPKAHPVGSESRRIQADIEHTLALVRKLDAEKGIEGNVLSSGDHDKPDVDKSHIGSMGPIIIIRGLTTVKGLEGVELLDTILTYLWRIHGVDYYGTSESHEAKGLRHVRVDNKTSSTSDVDAADWEKKLDTFWQERLNGQDPLVTLTAKDKIDAAAVEVLEPYVRKIRDEKYGWKYGCGAKGCTKLFHAPEFVHKHLRLKHPDIVLESTSKVREDLYFQNYMKYVSMILYLQLMDCMIKFRR